MRKLAIVTLLALSCLLAPAAVVRAADNPASVKKLIQTAENEMNAAAVRKDIATVLRYHTPDYTATMDDGRKYTRKQFETSMRQAFAAAKKITSVTVVTEISLKPGIATVMTQNHGTIVVTNRQTRKDVLLRVVNTDREVWVKQGNVWRKRSSKTLKATQTLNGKPLPNSGK